MLAFEPTCAAACAQREDRLAEVCPALEANLGETAQALGHGAEFTRLSRQFHALVADGTRNRAQRLMVRSVVAVWSIQEETSASEAEEFGRYPDLEAQRAALKAHRAIAKQIRQASPIWPNRPLGVISGRLSSSCSPNSVTGWLTRFLPVPLKCSATFRPAGTAAGCLSR